MAVIELAGTAGNDGSEKTEMEKDCELQYWNEAKTETRK